MIDREYPCFADVPIRVASMFTFYRRPQNDAKKSRIRPQVNHGTEYGQIVMPHAIRCTNDIRAFKPTQASPIPRESPMTAKHLDALMAVIS